MMEERPRETTGIRRACGVEGCLYAAVGLFFILLVGMLVLAAIRFSRPPEPRLGPQQPRTVGVAVPPAPALPPPRHA